MAADRSTPPREPSRTDQPSDNAEPLLTTPEDVASAGRSCMAIVVLVAAIVLLIAVWIVYRALGGE